MPKRIRLTLHIHPDGTVQLNVNAPSVTVKAMFVGTGKISVMSHSMRILRAVIAAERVRQDNEMS